MTFDLDILPIDLGVKIQINKVCPVGQENERDRQTDWLTVSKLLHPPLMQGVIIFKVHVL